MAGCLVNLFAIPLSDIYIQATLVCGLLGSLPVVGPTLGHLTAYVANGLGTGFLELAYRGADLFDFPSVARPSVWTLIVYYMALLAVVTWLKSREGAATKVADCPSGTAILILAGRQPKG